MSLQQTKRFTNAFCRVDFSPPALDEGLGGLKAPPSTYTDISSLLHEWLYLKFRKVSKPGAIAKLFCDMGSESPDVVSAEERRHTTPPDIRSSKVNLKVSEKGFGLKMATRPSRQAEVAGIGVIYFDKTKNKYG
jgi:hypothetical protein